VDDARLISECAARWPDVGEWAAELGFEVNVAAAQKLDAMIAAVNEGRRARLIGREEVLRVIVDALRAEDGLALRDTGRASASAVTVVALAVATDDAVTVGLGNANASTASPANVPGWGAVLRPWRKSLARNVDVCRAWAAVPGEGRLTLPRTAHSRPMTPESSSEEAALWTQITGDPADTSPRLVLADLLTARAEPLGELITLQLNPLPEGHPNALAQEARIAQLLEANGARWTRALSPFTTRAQFHRGLVEEIEIELKRWLTHSAELVRAAPLRILNLLRPSETQMKRFAADPSLSRIEQVRFLTGGPEQRGIGFEGLRTFLASPHLERVRGLVFQGQDLHVDAVALLCASPLDLHTLEFRHGNIPARAFDALRMPSLRRLRLAAIQVDDSLAAVLSKRAPALECLLIPGHHLSAGGLAALQLPSLTELDLSYGRPGDEWVDGLIRAQLRALRRLNLSGCEISHRKVLELTRLAPLNELRFTAADLRDDALLALLEAHPLRVLQAEGGRLTAQGLVTLARSPSAAHLEELYVRGVSIDDEAARALLESPHLARLRKLRVTAIGLPRRTGAELKRRFAFSWQEGWVP
jgi:uncharacterized protein (TIGR02996 family)